MSRFSPSDQRLGLRSALVTLRRRISYSDHVVEPVSSLVTVPPPRALFANIRGSPRATPARDPRAARRGNTPDSQVSAASVAGSSARALARGPALGRGTVFLPMAQARVAAKQLLATQASTASGLDHGASGPIGDQIMPRTAPAADLARAYAVIPIAGFTIIDAGTASSPPFQRTPKSVHHHAGIMFTFPWNSRSRYAGNRDHDGPEYALERAAIINNGNVAIVFCEQNE